MAARKHKASPTGKAPDRFHVGQTCALALDARSGYPERNGALVVVRTARRFGHWHCHAPGGPRPEEVQPGWRYGVDCPWGTWNVEEDMLRAIYDGEALSTWDEFARTTGLRLATSARSEP